MSGARDLADLLREATPGPWHIDPRSEVIEGADDSPVCAMFCVKSAQNAALITALVRNADALASLWEACENWREIFVQKDSSPLGELRLGAATAGIRSALLTLRGIEGPG